VDPLDIEDTSDWLGCPTELETIKHYARMLENEIQELTLQVRAARENIFGLVQMHADASEECSRLRTELKQLKTELAETSRKHSDLLSASNSILMMKDRKLAGYQQKLQELTGYTYPQSTPHRLS
jgi:chromosome segregation ATPase